MPNSNTQITQIKIIILQQATAALIENEAEPG